MSLILAYIDPGSGSLLLQLLAGGVLAASMFVKTYWHNLKAFFKKSDRKNTN